MRFLTLLLSIILLAAFLGMPSTGCESFGVRINPGIEPVTPQERIERAQKDLSTAWALAELLHAGGAFSDEQWEAIGTHYAVAQGAINFAGVVVDDNPDDLEAILKAMTKAVNNFKGRSAAPVE